MRQESERHVTALLASLSSADRRQLAAGLDVLKRTLTTAL
jgi:hypothetical protein